MVYWSIKLLDIHKKRPPSFRITQLRGDAGLFSPKLRFPLANFCVFWKAINHVMIMKVLFMFREFISTHANPSIFSSITPDNFLHNLSCYFNFPSMNLSSLSKLIEFPLIIDSFDALTFLACLA
jgi:hypothetical protein